MTFALPAEQSSFRAQATVVISIAVVLVYATVEIALFVNHDPWRDEGQAWLWATGLSGWQFLVVPGEGHPPGWFWLLRLLSGVLSFDQARLLTLGIAILNAVLLARLLERNVAALALLLFTSMVLTSWGFHFRPYGLVFTCVIAALLLDRGGREVAACWALVAACALHFFSGFLFGFYLLALLIRGRPVLPLVAPALVAAAFGLSAMLSGMGNQLAGIRFENLSLAYTIAIMPFQPPLVSGWIVALALPALLVYGLRKTPLLLALIAIVALFSIFAAVLYGRAGWHVTFILMLVVMAFVLAGPAAPRWVLAVLLLPQFVWGIRQAATDITQPGFAESEAYAALVADAGARLEPEKNLVAWPDFMLTTAAARHGFAYLGAASGEPLRAIDWRNYSRDVDAGFLASLPTPYWLVCDSCAVPLSALEAAGRRGVRLFGPATYFDQETISVYRIED